MYNKVINIYPWMSRKEIYKYIPDIIKYEVSERAREKDGFLNMYLMEKDLTQNYPNKNHNYYIERYNFIQRHLPQYQKKPTKRRFLALVAWAYLPQQMAPPQSSLSLYR